jgi:hypothetical protein
VVKEPGNPGAGAPAHPPQVGTINRREVTPDDTCSTSHEKGRPFASPITLGYQPSIAEPRGDPPKTARTR